MNGMLLDLTAFLAAEIAVLRLELVSNERQQRSLHRTALVVLSLWRVEGRLRTMNRRCPPKKKVLKRLVLVLTTFISVFSFKCCFVARVISITAFITMLLFRTLASQAYLVGQTSS